MDAATPFRRWLLAAGLAPLAVAGCHTPTEPGYTRPVAELRAEEEAEFLRNNPGVKPPVARPQAPSDPLAPIPPGPTPPAPVAPSSPVPPVNPTVPGTPVVGQPVTPAAPTVGAAQPIGQPVPAGYS